MAKVTIVYEDVIQDGKPSVSMSCLVNPALPAEGVDGVTLTPAQALGVHTYAVAHEVCRAKDEQDKGGSSFPPSLKRFMETDGREPINPDEFRGVRK